MILHEKISDQGYIHRWKTQGKIIFILTKGGYTARPGFQLPEFCYLKESAAKMAATKYQKAEDPECPVKYEVIEV